MGKKPFHYVLSLLTATAFIAAGCSGIFPSAQQVPDGGQPTISVDVPETPSRTPVEMEPTNALAAPATTVTAVPEATETQVQVPAETSEPAPAPVEPRQGLEASDPTGAVLVSGQIQLVEFFAFW